VFAFEGTGGHQPDAKKTMGRASVANIRIHYIQPAIAKYWLTVDFHYYAQVQRGWALRDIEKIARQNHAFRYSNLGAPGGVVKALLGTDEYDRIVLLGYSWGGEAAVEVAWQLKRSGADLLKFGPRGDFLVLRSGFANADPIVPDLVFTIDPVPKPNPRVAQL